MADENTVIEPTPEQLQEETEAKNIGWAPKDQYKGDPEKWVDAHTFLERGQHVMPILRKNNERLQADIGRVREENTKLQSLVKASQESIQALEEFHTAETARQVETARKNLLAQLKIAKKDGDIEGEVDLTDELTRLNAAAAKAEEKPAKKNGEDTTTRPEVHPEFKVWAAEHPWYGTDPLKTHLALGIAQKMRDSGDMRVGRPFMDEVTAEVDRAERAMKGLPAQSKVESPRGGSGGSPANGKRFSDLPPDAQASCHRFSSRLVGPGRAYKTEADWESAYTKKYLEGEGT